MASLRFYYSGMGAGKSSHLLQASYNYNERGMSTIIFNAKINNRDGVNQVKSRIGISAPASTFDTNTNIFNEVNERFVLLNKPLSCVLIDEAQFLTKDQVDQLGRIVDFLCIPVLAYGLRTDYQGKLFEGSKALLAIADHLDEIKGICFCGKKATMVARISSDGFAVKSGEQIVIGGNDSYVSLCRKHHTEALEHKMRLN